MYTITFYSFKGVGRTMALVNVAAELATRGKTVLLVDFDLEAPGLDTANLCPRTRATNDAAVKKLLLGLSQGTARNPLPTAWRPGLVEYVTRYSNTGEMPAVNDYLYDAGTFGQKGGRIWVMPAGLRDQDYRHALAQLDWISLYQSHNGFAFLNQMKQQWKDVLQPDYVLIDCPSGHTNVEGICTRQLPDAVVVLLFPDAQNVAGMLPVCQDIRTETDRGRQEPITLHFVLSNVPVLEDEREDFSRRQVSFFQELGIRDLAATLHHREGLIPFDRCIWVLDHPGTALSREYRALVDALVVHNVEDEQGGLLFLKVMEQIYLKGAVGFEREEEERRLARFWNRHWENAPFLAKVASCLMVGERFNDAEHVLDQVLDKLPQLPEALFQRARCREKVNNNKGAVEDLQTYLGLPGLEEKQIVPALRRLYNLAPEQIDDLLKQDEGPTTRQQPQWFHALDRLDPMGLKTILQRAARDVTERREWTPKQRLRRRIRDLEMRIQSLIEKRSRIQSPEEPQTKRALEDWERNWNAFLLAQDHFDLAMTLWDATGRLPVEPCLSGLDYHKQIKDDLKNTKGVVVKQSPSYRQLVALALWRIGKKSEPLDEIREAEESAGSDLEGTIYESPWSGLEEVTREQFLRDCEAIRNLINGVPGIQPAFLREASAN